MTMSNSSPQNVKTRGSRNTISGAAAALWASAFVIIALIIVQAGRLPGNHEAFAGTAADRGSYALLTASAGTGPEAAPNELLFVIDYRDQVLLAYEVEDAHKKGITLRDGGSLDNMFIRARQ